MQCDSGACGTQIQPLAARLGDAQHAHAAAAVAVRPDVQRVLAARQAGEVGDGRSQRLRGARQRARQVHHAAHDGRLLRRQLGCGGGRQGGARRSVSARRRRALRWTWGCEAVRGNAARAARTQPLRVPARDDGHVALAHQRLQAAGVLHGGALRAAVMWAARCAARSTRRGACRGAHGRPRRRRSAPWRRAASAAGARRGGARAELAHACSRVGPACSLAHLHSRGSRGGAAAAAHGRRGVVGAA
jgi:hypothetical protein